MLSTFDRILAALTYTVGGVAAISLIVAGILIMNVMLVSVSQRRSEIGLLKALGARRRDVQRLFLVEALMLASLGAALGLLAGLGGVLALQRLYPQFPAAAPVWALLATPVFALGAGLVFGVFPARRAAALDPVSALARR